MTNHTPTPKDNVQTIDLDPATAYVLVELLDVALQDGILIEEPHEYGAAARLLAMITTENSPHGELTPGVRNHTALNNDLWEDHQQALVEYYENETGVNIKHPSTTDSENTE